MRRRILTPAVALLLTGIALSESPAQSGRKGVEAAVNRLINAVNKVKLDAVFAEFVPDAEMLDNGVRYASLDAVRATYGPGFKALRKQDIKVERSNIQMVTPALAIYTGSGTFTATDTTGAKSPRRTFAWTIVWREDKGAWKGTSIHQSIAAPPAAAATVTQAGKSASDAMTEFRAQVAVHAAAINKRDAAAVAATFTANADQVVNSGPRVVGRNAIRDATKQELATWPKGRRITITLTDAHLIAPDIAIVETDATFSDGGLPPNRGTAVTVREGGKWLISSLRVYPAAAKR